MTSHPKKRTAKFSFARVSSLPKRLVQSLLLNSGEQKTAELISRSTLAVDVLEDRTLLAAMLPDMFAWASQSKGYLHDYRVEGSLLRFTTALANQGTGHLELRGGAVLANGNQEVFQRIFNDNGTFADRLAGQFTYHSSHGHIHFDGYAIYNLRANVDGQVGAVVRSGGKISFCLLDVAKYVSSAGSARYGSCGQVQGVTAGWSDVYNRTLPDQLIDITGIADGNYFLEVVVDPDNQLVESNETNNITAIPVTIAGGPGATGDRFESNNSFATATSLGVVTSRTEVGLSIHTTTDRDFYRFDAASNGVFSVDSLFNHSFGNLSMFAYSSNQSLVASSTSADDDEHIEWNAVGGQSYFVEVRGASGAINGYSLDFDGPGLVFTQTVPSTNVPISIPDATVNGSPGTTVFSRIQGPDVTLTDLNLVFNDFRHTWIGDLNMTLTSPRGTSATIFTSVAQPTGGLLGGQAPLINTRLDDQASNNLSNAVSPATGSFNVQYSSVVNNPFSRFNGENAEGLWTLAITDWGLVDVGTLQAWSLEFTGAFNTQLDRFEPNNEFPQAIDFGVLGERLETNLSIHSGTDRDYFRFIAGADSTADIDLAFTHASGNLELVVYNSQLVEIARSNGNTNNEQLAISVVGGELYYVRVSGVGGATNSYQLDLKVATTIGESGSVSVDHQWRQVTFSRPIVNPLVFTSANSGFESQPFVTQIRNMTSTGFEVRIAEWNYLDRIHASETVSYLAIAAGRHVLDDGTVLEAGTSSTTAGRSRTVNFAQSFSTTPIVIAQPVTGSSLTPVIPRVSSTRTNSFSMRLYTEEAVGRTLVAGSFNWLAIRQLAGTTGATKYEAVRTPTAVNGGEYPVTFANNYFESPVVLAGAQTLLDSDPFDVRITHVTGTGARFYLQEEASLDAELVHANESLGYFVLSPGKLFKRRTASAPLVASFTVAPTMSFSTAVQVNLYSRPAYSIIPRSSSRSLIEFSSRAVQIVADNAWPDFDSIELTNAVRSTKSVQTTQWVSIPAQLDSRSKDS